MRLVRLMLLWLSQKLVSVALARLPHITKRQAVARRHNGNAGLSTQVRSAKEKDPCSWSGSRTPCLAISRTLPCRYPQCIVVEFLTLLPVYPPKHRRVPFHVYPGTRPPVSRITSTPSSVATSSGSSPSQASETGPSSLLKTRGPCS